MLCYPASSKSRLGVVFLIIICLVALGSTGTTALTSNRRCPPLASPQGAFVSWKDDTNYELVETTGPNGKTIRVTGDIINFVDKDFGSLIRDVDKSPTNVRQIIFDAREIHLEAPVAFDSARIVFLTDQLHVGPHAAIYLTKDPGGATDGLFVSSRSIDFDDALPKPFQFTTSSSGKRSVRIRARTIRSGGRDLSAADAVGDIWRRSSEFTGVGAVPPASWDVKVDEEGYSESLADLRVDATWPLFTAFKVQKFFTRDPFGSDGQPTEPYRLSVLISIYRPLFEKIGANDAVSQIDAVSTLLRLGLDSQGHQPAYVPRQDYKHSFDSLSADVANAPGDLNRLKQLILGAYDGKRIADADLAAVRGRIRTSDKQADELRRQMGDAVTSLAQNQGDVDGLNAQLQQRQSTLAQQLADLRDRDRDAAKIKGATTVVAMGAMLIPGPAGPIVATGISVTGGLIYNHNVGDGSTSLETLTTIISKNAKFYASAKAVQASWQQQLKDIDVAKRVFAGAAPPPADPKDKPLDRAQASKLAAQSASQFASHVKEMLDELQDLPKPTDVSMSALEAGDGILQSLLAQIGDLTQRQTSIIATIAETEKQLAVVSQDAANDTTVESDLLAALPVNDREIMRWKLSAVALWRRHVERLYNDAILVRRSLFFETGKLPDLPGDIFQFPEEMIAYIRSGLYSPDGSQGSPRSLTDQHLTDEINKHVAALRSIVAGMDYAFRDYESERAGGATPYDQSFSIRADPNSSSTQASFLKHLNNQVALQVKAADVLDFRREPLLVPMELPWPPEDLPERLVSVGVSNLVIANPGALRGKTINLDVRYELAGELIRGPACHYVDMRAQGAQSYVVQRAQAASSQTLSTAPVLPLTFEEFKKYQTAPPARTPLFVSVQITGDAQDPNWGNIPVINGITFTLRIVQ